MRIRVRDKATERRKRSKVKEREGEESMVCSKVISLSRISKSFLLVISLHLVVFYLKDLSGIASDIGLIADWVQETFVKAWSFLLNKNGNLNVQFN